MKRPMLPRELYRPSHVWAALYLGFAVCLYFLPAAANYLVAKSSWPVMAKVAAMFPLTVLAAYGINMMGFVGHEGMHGSLVRSRVSSAVIGLFYASAVLTYCEFGFALSHWNHHRFTNQKDDPDIQAVRHLKTWWQRLLLSRPIYNWLYLKNTVRAACGLPDKFKYRMPFSQKTQQRLAWLNLLFALIWLGFYVSLFFINLRLGAFAVLLPMITVNFIGACQTYIDHAGLDDRIFHNAYSRISRINTVLYFGANYHLEHHAYPGIPCYRLPKVHKLLVAHGVFSASAFPIVPSFAAGFRALSRPYEAGNRGDDFDAFRVATSGG